MFYKQMHLTLNLREDKKLAKEEQAKKMKEPVRREVNIGKIDIKDSDNNEKTIWKMI